MIFVLDNGNNKIEGMTKEEIYAAIESATGNIPEGVDDAFITMIKESNRSENIKIWCGTEAEYLALEEIDEDVLYCLTDVDDLESIEQRVGTLEDKMDSIYLGVEIVTCKLTGTTISEQSKSYSQIVDSLNKNKNIVIKCQTGTSAYQYFHISDKRGELALVFTYLQGHNTETILITNSNQWTYSEEDVFKSVEVVTCELVSGTTAINNPSHSYSQMLQMIEAGKTIVVKMTNGSGYNWFELDRKMGNTALIFSSVLGYIQVTGGNVWTFNENDDCNVAIVTANVKLTAGQEAITGASHTFNEIKGLITQGKVVALHLTRTDATQQYFSFVDDITNTRLTFAKIGNIYVELASNNTWTVIVQG